MVGGDGPRGEEGEKGMAEEGVHVWERRLGRCEEPWGGDGRWGMGRGWPARRLGTGGHSEIPPVAQNMSKIVWRG